MKTAFLVGFTLALMRYNFMRGIVVGSAVMLLWKGF